MQQLKIAAIGNSAGVILPKDVLSRLKVDKGDTLFLIETPDGYRITPHDPVFEAQMTAARHHRFEHSPQPVWQRHQAQRRHARLEAHPLAQLLRLQHR